MKNATKTGLRGLAAPGPETLSFIKKIGFETVNKEHSFKMQQDAIEIKTFTPQGNLKNQKYFPAVV